MNSKTQESLDLCLVRITNPLNANIDEESIADLLRAIDETREGSQISLQFIAHKIQSPQEIEALQALNASELLFTVLDLLSQKGDSKVNSEIGKFRFLNDLIKVVSPKYLAHRSSPKVKQKVIELIFKWSVEMKSEPKIAEAYKMLKKQGIVFKDPIYVLPDCEINVPPRRKDEIFGDEENSKTLQKLLQSKDPQDLQAANKLIKMMVREADKKINLKARCSTELETVYNNARVLSDMLMHYIPGRTTEEELELFKELFDSCESLRPKLFRLAAEMDEKDPELRDILLANDQLTKVINEYKFKMDLSGPRSPNSSSCHSEPTLLDLNSPGQEADVSLLNDHLVELSLDCDYNNPTKNNGVNNDNANAILSLDSFPCNGSSTSGNILVPETSSSNWKLGSQHYSTNTTSSLDELEDMMWRCVAKEKKVDTTSIKTPLNQLQKFNMQETLKNNSLNSSPISAKDANSLPPPLTDIPQISLDSVEPSYYSPILLMENNGIKVMLNFASAKLIRSDVTVMVITIVNTNKTAISNVNFQAAVPKNMRVKLQTPSSTSLPAYNPFLPPSAITQVMLIARNNCDSDKVRFKYRLNYVINENSVTDVGEIEHLFSNIE